MQFPNGKQFAFTILDDTDDSTVANVRPVYECLYELGMRTTKTVWPMGCPEGSRLFYAGETLEHVGHLAFSHELATRGFEIALHGATMESSLRERTLDGLAFLKREFGALPRLYANHGFNRDNLYWGAKRFQGIPFQFFPKRQSKETDVIFEGDVEGSQYFWGDLARAHIEYVRNFTFHDLNMLDVNPEMPYRLASTPFVNFWFSTTDAPDARAFKHLVTHHAIDRLEQCGGVCIISTHLGKGYAPHGYLDPEVKTILEYMSGKAGWFVPVSTLLDFLREQPQSGHFLSYWTCLKLELRYLLDRLLWLRPTRYS